MVKRIDKKIVDLAIKYSAEKWKCLRLLSLEYEERDRLAFDICEAIDKYNGAEIKDEQKALDAIRNEDGLMLTCSAKGQHTWSTARGTLISRPTAKLLIDRGMVKPADMGLLGNQPQLYQATLR